MLSIVAFRLALNVSRRNETKRTLLKGREHENTGSVLPSVFHMFHAEQKMDLILMNLSLQRNSNYAEHGGKQQQTSELVTNEKRNFNLIKNFQSQ